MKPIVQEEKTGCAIASAAALAGITYAEAKSTANSIGIYADDPALWSETNYIHKLLEKLGLNVGQEEIPFSDWNSLPELVLLSIKWHLERGTPYWHWVIFVREGEHSYVLDSKKGLKSNIRTDFWRMKPKWYIDIRMCSTLS